MGRRALEPLGSLSRAGAPGTSISGQRRKPRQSVPAQLFRSGGRNGRVRRRRRVLEPQRDAHRSRRAGEAPGGDRVPRVFRSPRDRAVRRTEFHSRGRPARRAAGRGSGLRTLSAPIRGRSGRRRPRGATRRDVGDDRRDRTASISPTRLLRPSSTSPFGFPATGRTREGALTAAFEFSTWSRAFRTKPRSRRRRVRIAALSARLAREYPDSNLAYELEVEDMREVERGPLRAPLFLLGGSLFLLLLLICANVSGLWIARLVGRERELAVRAAVGASRARLFRELLAEALVVSILGFVAGGIVGAWIAAGSRAAAPPGLPIPPAIEPGGPYPALFLRVAPSDVPRFRVRARPPRTPKESRDHSSSRRTSRGGKRGRPKGAGGLRDGPRIDASGLGGAAAEKLPCPRPRGNAGSERRTCTSRASSFLSRAIERAIFERGSSTRFNLGFARRPESRMRASLSDFPSIPEPSSS